jgi:H/ACA ribonucleoprotein complex subunit 3
MFKCKACQEYTLKTICPKCGQKCNVPVPARYSPEDKYGEYRRKLIMRGKQ